MKRLQILISLFAVLNCIGQSKTDKLTKPIIEEGKKLYQSEMASWYGTDIFLAKYPNKEKIGGYFSYSENDKSKCIFFSKEEKPKVIGTIIFDSTFDINKATTVLEERTFTKNELDYYILTGPNINGVVLFGNDYLLNFDKKNNFISRKVLHKNLIPIQYKKGQTDVETMHNHQDETGDFITATDICTLMLYEKFANWKNHIVVSKNYASIWNCKTNELFVITMEAFKKISETK